MTTIYVAQSQTELKLQSRQLQVYHQQRFCFAVPVDRIHQIVILGQHPWTRKAANLALSLHIPVVYFEPDGRCVEYVNPGNCEPAKYLKAQMQQSQNSEFTRSIAESLVRAKLHNARILLLQLSQDFQPATVQQVLTLLQRLIDGLPMASSLIALKHYEDTGSAFYRAALSRLLPEEFRSHNRGLNPIQRLTNLGTALLSQRIQTILQASGLDLEVANLHFDAVHRPPLVCDFLMEFQSAIVDRIGMELLQSGQIVPDDFVWVDGGIFLQPSALERFIQHWDAMLLSRVQHLYAGEVSYHRCLEVQVQEYVACLLEDQAFYRPMLLKR
ncbi:CRISPR-associated endonuclease Cas1 [Leptolyngbya sp. AN03gr2]|uniref:CRISPR-associated endonuclease Cas1 n=1 Tax=unclassified Leptolyngbya TaxID=2650499 RepID=UPI003D318546